MRASSITDCPSGGTSFVICATFGTSITGNAQATTIENTINTAITQVESQFFNPITVNISFDNATPGDGNLPSGDIAFNSTNNYVITYQQFISALGLDASRPDDVAALLYLPNQTNIPGTAVTDMLIHSANAEALGISIPNVVSSAASPDGQVYLDLAAMNLSRSTTPTNSQYDLETVTMHEIDEVLGLSSTLDQGYPAPYNGYYSPLDLFRYDSSGNRSFSESTSTPAWFEVTPGAKIVQFNSTAGSDYGEWKNISGHVQVQDSIGTLGKAAQVGLGANEIEALGVIGFDTVPEPSTWSMFGFGLAACGLLRGMRKKA